MLLALHTVSRSAGHDILQGVKLQSTKSSPETKFKPANKLNQSEAVILIKMFTEKHA